LKLYNEDCLIAMDRMIEDGVKVDAIITDPPYGTTACKWDSVIPFDLMWEQLKRVIKPDGAIVLFGSEPFSSALRMSNIKQYKYDWVWKKERGTNFLNFKYQPSKETENIMVFGNMATSYSKKGNLIYYPQMREGKAYTQKQGFIGDAVARDKGSRENKKNIVTKNKGTRYPSNLLEFSNEKGLHPTQKPLTLMEYLIKTYTNESETVLDFTMGSGTTGVACKNLNRDFIGIELDKDYFEIAKERIEKHTTQERLF